MSAVNWTALEREYSPSSVVSNLPALIEHYRIASRAARALIPPVSLPYGQRPEETVDIFLSQPRPAPTHAFVHGGYWQELGKRDSSFPALPFVGRGTTYVAIDYGLAPMYALDDMVEQVRSAVSWIYRQAGFLGIDDARIVLSGSSAGAHLAAMAALTDWSARGFDRNPIAGLVLLSGIYDLRPLVGTYINDALGMTMDSAERNSPLQRLLSPAELPPALVCWGEHETDAFKNQSAAFALAWRQAGGHVSSVEVAGRNHFDIVHDLGDVDTQLGELVDTHTRIWSAI